MLKTLATNSIRSGAIKPMLGLRPFQTGTKAVFAQSPDAESEYLRAQRKLRPVSPHLTIYQPQLTWYMSSFHRITGAAVGGAFYLGALAYVAAPALGYQIESESILSALATVSEPVKITTKAIVAAPFVYHSANGIRHLVWDAGKCVDIKSVYKTGYAVLATTAIGTIYLATL